MAFAFATSDRTLALRFLRKFYQSHDIKADAPEVVAVLDLVEKDIVRIPDPDFHPGGAVLPSTRWDASCEAEVVATFSTFHQYALAQPMAGGAA